jgi:hypothetical protein
MAKATKAAAVDEVWRVLKETAGIYPDMSRPGMWAPKPADATAPNHGTVAAVAAGRLAEMDLPVAAYNAVAELIYQVAKAQGQRP